MARHRSWGQGDGGRPIGVDLLSAEDHDGAVALLIHARDQLGLEDSWCEITAPIEAADSASDAHPDLVAILVESGFEFQVARVKVEWTPCSHLPPDSGRLTFRPARDLDERPLVTLFRAVTDGSLDHAMVTQRSEVGDDSEARDRLDAVRSYRAQPDWFSVAFDSNEDPIGYVVPCLVEDDIPVVGEVGVVADHRGHGYGNDLLSHATRLLAASGAERIVADTDCANTAMRTVFGAGCYREQRWRDDYRWRRYRQVA